MNYEIETLIDRGDDLYQRGDYERAIDCYIRALEMDVHNPEALEGLGQSHASLNNWEDAVRVFEQLVAAEPECASSHYILGHSLGVLGDHDHALAELRRAERLGCNTAEVHSAIGYSLHVKGDIERAIEAYRLALDLDPEDTTTLFNMGKALDAQRSYYAARSALEDAIALDPDDPQAWIALGEVHEHLNEWDPALRAYGRALDLDPTNSDIRYLAARACLVMGKLDEAESEYRQVVADNPDDVDAWAGLGEVLAAQERYQAALDVCRRAIEIDPESSCAISSYVEVCEQIGAFEEARNVVMAAISKVPGDPDMWYLLAGVEASAERPESALSAYERTARLSPYHAAAHAGIGWALVEMGHDQARAEVHLMEAVRLAPEWYYPYLQLGELFLQKNDRQMAAKWFSRAKEVSPDEPDVCEVLSDPEIRRLVNEHQCAK